MKKENEFILKTLDVEIENYENYLKNNSENDFNLNEEPWIKNLFQGHKLALKIAKELKEIISNCDNEIDFNFVLNKQLWDENFIETIKQTLTKK